MRIRTIARATTEHDPAVALAAVLGRPFPGIELFDRIGDIVFFIKDHEARYVAVNDTLARRCGFADSHALIGRKASEVFAAPLGERFEAQDLKVIAEGLSVRGRMELHLYPDGGEGWCLSWKEPLIDAAGAIRGLVGVSRDAPALSDRRRFRPRSQPCSPISTTISTSPCAFRSWRREPAFPRSSSIKESGLCAASPPGNICPAFASTGRVIGSGTPTPL